MRKKINGRVLAKSVLSQLKKRTKRLKKESIIPSLAIFSAGDDPASLSFIKGKERAAKEIGANLKHFKFKKETSYQKFAEALNRIGRNPKFSGIIIQRPLPVSLTHSSLNLIIPLEKDIDGANPKSPFTPPVAIAVLRALDFVRTGEKVKELLSYEMFPSESLINWLNHHSILLIGRGETAGKPIAKTFTNKRIKFLITHQATEDLPRFVKKSDIVISCVGKRIIKKEMFKQGTILIGVGIRKDKEGRFRGDFDERGIKDIVSYYTPTPGGIGPLTVACLMENLVRAAESASEESFLTTIYFL